MTNKLELNSISLDEKGRIEVTYNSPVDDGFVSVTEQPSSFNDHPNTTYLFMAHENYQIVGDTDETNEDIVFLQAKQTEELIGFPVVVLKIIKR